MGTSLITTMTLIVTSVFVVLATGAVCLRLYLQNVYSTMRMGADDYFIVLALAFCYAILAGTITAGAVGGVNDLKNESSAVWFVKMLYIEPFLVNPTLALTKLSIMLFYNKIFVTKKFHLACYTMMGVVCLWCLATVLVQLTWVSPISNAWNLSGTYYRLNYGAAILSFAGINTGLDMLVFLLPLPVISTLQMRTKQKLMTVGIFSLGIFCIVAGAFRLYYAILELRTAVQAANDSRYALNTLYMWDRIEPCASTICACLPTYGPLIRRSSIIGMLKRLKNIYPSSSSGSAPPRGESLILASKPSQPKKTPKKGSHSVVIGYDADLEPQEYPLDHVHITSEWEVERGSNRSA